MSASLPDRWVHWRGRVLGGALLVVLVLAGTWVMDFGPRVVPLVLLVATAVVASWVVVDGVTVVITDWGRPAGAEPTPAGRDRLLATYRRVLEGHATARHPDGALRDRLLELARLRGPHDDPVLHTLATGPPRRLSPTEIDDILRRIEQL